MAKTQNQKFKLKKGDHEVSTSLPTEVTQLRAAGYVPVKTKAATAAPAPASTAAKK